MSHEPPADVSRHPVPPRVDLAPGPAFALLTQDGYAVASTDVFTRLVGLPVLSTPAATTAVAEVTSGRTESVAFTVSLPDAREAPARVEAVNDAHERLTLLEVAVPRPSGGAEQIGDWFARFGDDSPAVIWLKDLEGRYLSVNGQYTAQLGADTARVRGRTDAELSQVEAIDGPRSKRIGGPEPVQLEYVIPAFDRRPAYTALRFPVNDAAGAPVAICGVASPADQAEVANTECERLLAVGEWLSGDPATLRRHVLAHWGITAVAPDPGRRPVAPQAGGANPEVELPAATAPRPAPTPGPAPAEFTELLASLQRQVSDLQAKVTVPAPAPSELGDLPAQLAAERERANAAEAARRTLETRVLAISEQLVASQAQVAELQAALAAAHDQMTRLERAVAAATAAAAGPIVPAAPIVPAGPSTAPPEGAATAVRLGWDATAQAALAEGLRGCLNVRSIFSEAVRLIGGAGGWDAVFAWLADDADGRWGAAATWVRDPLAMASLETSISPVRPSPGVSALAAAASASETTWITDLGHSGDPHLAQLGAAGIATVVLLPVRREGRVIGILELASTARAARSPAAEAALGSMETEVAAAHQRVTDTASASQWGRRSR